MQHRITRITQNRMEIREGRANLGCELRTKHFLLLFLPVFGQKPGQFRTHGTMGHVAEAVANFGMSAALRPVLGAFQPSSRGTPTGAEPLSRVVGLSAFAWMRYLCIGLFSLSNHRLVHLTPLSRAHYLSRSSPRCCPSLPLPVYNRK